MSERKHDKYAGMYIMNRGGQPFSEAIDELKGVRYTFVGGLAGAGKSYLLNLLAQDLDLRTVYYDFILAEQRQRLGPDDNWSVGDRRQTDWLIKTAIRKTELEYPENHIGIEFPLIGPELRGQLTATQHTADQTYKLDPVYENAIIIVIPLKDVLSLSREVRSTLRHAQSYEEYEQIAQEKNIQVILPEAAKSEAGFKALKRLMENMASAEEIDQLEDRLANAVSSWRERLKEKNEEWVYDIYLHFAHIPDEIIEEYNLSAVEIRLIQDMAAFWLSYLRDDIGFIENQIYILLNTKSKSPSEYLTDMLNKMMQKILAEDTSNQSSDQGFQ